MTSHHSDLMNGTALNSHAPIDESAMYYSGEGGVANHQSSIKKPAGRKITATGIHINNTGPPAKFRRNQYNQLNVTTNPAIGVFSSVESG